MKLGIVGHEAAKFSRAMETDARSRITKYIMQYKPELVVSGACHLGGIDIWAVEIARELGFEVLEHAPRVWDWSKPGGYKERNLKIANQSDLVLVVVVQSYISNYKGMRFHNCYHCKSSSHIKSGACWTAKRCRSAVWEIVPTVEDQLCD